MVSRRVGLVFSIGAVFIALAAAPYLMQRTTDAAAESLPVLASIDGFELTGQDGETFSSESLRGSVWIADFIFTRCPGACPQMTSTLQDVFRDFGANPDFKLVSISVDPDHDTPEILSAFAETYEADPNRWHFLTGANPFIQKLSQEQFKIAAAETPASHSLRFILVDRNGDIRGYYHSTDPEDVEQMRADLAKLLAARA